MSLDLQSCVTGRHRATARSHGLSELLSEEESPKSSLARSEGVSPWNLQANQATYKSGYGAYWTKPPVHGLFPQRVVQDEPEARASLAELGRNIVCRLWNDGQRPRTAAADQHYRRNRPFHCDREGFNSSPMIWIRPSSRPAHARVVKKYVFV
jgi:hypothetical protein